MAFAAGNTALTRGVLHKWVFSGFRCFVVRGKGGKPSVRLQQDCLFCVALFCSVVVLSRKEIQIQDLPAYFSFFSFLTMTNSG